MTIDANDLEKIAKERPDECFLKGSGVLKLIGAIRQLEREARQATVSEARPVAEIVGDLQFEGWLSENVKRTGHYIKQDMREAYWAGYQERAAFPAPDVRPSPDLEGHRVMTREEYDALKLKGWHQVCHNMDSAGSTAIRYGSPDVRPSVPSEQLMGAALTALETLRGYCATAIEDRQKDSYSLLDRVLPQECAIGWASELHGIDVRSFLNEAISDADLSLASQPAAPVQEPSMWTVTHNGKSITADSLFKAMKAAQALRTDEEAQIAAENLLRAIDEELSQEPEAAAQPQEASISMSQFATKDDYYEAMEREHLGDADKRTGIYVAAPAPSVSADPLQELADQAQELDMGYGPDACPTCGKSAPSVGADAREFKNFHRLLCERFDYVHDEVDWKRDQISLIEHIAVRAVIAARPAESVSADAKEAELPPLPEPEQQWADGSPPAAGWWDTKAINPWTRKEYEIQLWWGGHSWRASPNSPAATFLRQGRQWRGLAAVPAVQAAPSVSAKGDAVCKECSGCRYDRDLGTDYACSACEGTGKQPSAPPVSINATLLQEIKALAEIGMSSGLMADDYCSQIMEKINAAKAVSADAGNQAQMIGPVEVVERRLTCNGCAALTTKEWVDYVDGETDTGTSANCAAAGNKSITAYWYEKNTPPTWCPAAIGTQSKEASE